MRSILSVCEQSGYRCLKTILFLVKRREMWCITRNTRSKIVNDWAIFEANKKPDAQHTKRM